MISIDAFTDISVFHCDSTFTKKAKNKNNYYKTRKFLVGKFILYSINIDPDDIHFTDFIINEIKNVSNTVKNDYQNGKELDNIFKEYGFYIPLTVYIGGIFSTNDQDTIFIKNGNNKTDFNLAFDLIQKLVGKGKVLMKLILMNYLKSSALILKEVIFILQIIKIGKHQ